MRPLLYLPVGLWLACTGGLGDPADGGGADVAVADVPAEGAPSVDPMCRLDGVSLPAACSAYCSNVTRYCVGSDTQFPSAEACQAACNRPTWSCGTPGEDSGDTVFCRNSYAGRAMTDPTTNCPEAGPNSDKCQ
jgi:hypothetical protein